MARNASDAGEERSAGVNVDLALIAYLVPLLGPLFILVARKDHAFARYHARQSLLLVVVAVVAPALWVVFAWLVTLAPYGSILAAFSFSLIIALYFGIVLAWLAGIRHALKAEMRPVPFFGGWVD